MEAFPCNIATIEEEVFDKPAAFERVWLRYPNKDGKKQAFRHFSASVKTVNDLSKIIQALGNYLISANVKKGFVKNGSTWFNNWRDWIEPSEIMIQGNGGKKTSIQQQARDWVNK